MGVEAVRLSDCGAAPGAESSSDWVDRLLHMGVLLGLLGVLLSGLVALVGEPA